MAGLSWNLIFRSDMRRNNDSDEQPRKPLTAYALFVLILVFIIGPQPSVFMMCLSHYYKTRRSTLVFTTHLVVGYTLLIMMGSSLIVSIARDPGSVKSLEEIEAGNGSDTGAQRVDERGAERGTSEGEISLVEALLPNNDVGEEFSLTPLKSNGESRWCRKCWAPKPERTHHCSECNRCVLKMDHHCPWLANRCVGVRTYPSFLHFLLTTTVYSAYMFFVSVPVIQHFLGQPFVLDDMDWTPYHAMTVALMGAVFSLTVGSFFIYHLYLTLSNQTTLESLAPMLLLQYLPPIEASSQHQSSSTSLDHPPPFSSEPPSPRLSESSNGSEVPLPPYTRSASANGSTMAAQGGHRPSHTFAEPFRFPSPPPQPPKRWQEHQLNRKQRRIVRDAAAHIRIYDIGWKDNLLDVLGGPEPNAFRSPHRSYHGERDPSRKRGTQWGIWFERILWGGRGRGDGHSFRHNPKAEDLLRTLAAELAAASTNDR